MRFTKNLPYKIKRLVPVLGLAGAATMMPGCDKSDEPIQATQDAELPVISKPNQEFLYTFDENGNRIASAMLQYYIDNPQIRTIYLVPKAGDFAGFDAMDIVSFRHNELEQVFTFSPKIRGRGDFVFPWREPSKVPEDSLWFVEHGWTVNKALAERHGFIFNNQGKQK